MAGSAAVDYLTSLNEAQRRAVTHPPDSALQILAGPGSGKTRVLTSRVAHLILHHQIPAYQICCVTFTNKAANEMRERLVRLVGDERTTKLVMGTFHALCAKYLRKHGQTIGLQNNFSIVDTDAGKRLVANVLRSKEGEMKVLNITLKDTDALSRISSFKAKGVSPEAAHVLGMCENNDFKVFLADVYDGYEAELKRCNSLDFDDLLVYGVSLFKEAPEILRNIRHILVDEFQDTNSMQYQLMNNFARARGAVTIVGDPDQSIYGWRAADIGNLEKMRNEFPKTTQIFLEENYRSTGSILASSLAIVAQDENRIDKGLHTSHPQGALPVNRSFPGDMAESEFIAKEVKRLIAYSGGMLTYKDFAVLLRYNALSRQIESSLQREGIPNRVLAGQKFFDRLEIRDLLAYLQLIDNPQFTPAFVRIINVPRRAIGEKSVEEILERAKAKEVSPMELIEKISNGRWPDIKPPIRNKVRDFLSAIQLLRKLARQPMSVASLLQRLIEHIKYEEWLHRTQQDWEMRWENVRELVNYASQVDHEQAPATGITDFEDDSAESEPDHPLRDPKVLGQTKIGDMTEKVDQLLDGELPITDLSMREVMAETPLRRFLETSMLATDTEDADADNQDKVTISTCHAAKGLEWPVVFIPACENGVFPFYRSDDIDEERRLLYVACTRAQVFLYLTHTQKRMVQGTLKDATKSEYLTAALKTDRNLFTARTPVVTFEECKIISKVVERILPEREVVEAKADEHRRLNPEPDRRSTRDSSSSQDENRIPSQGFMTGLGVHQSGAWPMQQRSRLTMKPFTSPMTNTSAPLQSRPTNEAIPPSRTAVGLAGIPPVTAYQSYQAVQPQAALPTYSTGFVSYAGASFSHEGQVVSTSSTTSVVKVESCSQVPSSTITLAGGRKRLGMGPMRAIPPKKPKCET